MLFFYVDVCYASNLKGAMAFQSYDIVRLPIGVTWLSVGYVTFAVGSSFS